MELLTLAQRRRLAEAYRARQTSARPAPVPTCRAESSEPCRQCGIPGFRGCDHQLPYERPEGADMGPRTSVSLKARGVFSAEARDSVALLEDVESYLGRQRMRAWRFEEAVGLPGLVKRLRAGSGVRPDTAARVRDFIGRRRD